MSPSPGCDFDFTQARTVACTEVQDIRVEMQSLFGLHSKNRFLDLTMFSKKIYLIHTTNLWVPDGGHAVCLSVLVHVWCSATSEWFLLLFCVFDRQALQSSLISVVRKMV